MVFCEKTAPNSTFWKRLVLSENIHWDIDFSPGTRDIVFLPFRGEGGPGDEAENDGSEKAVSAQAESPVRLRNSYRPTPVPQPRCVILEARIRLTGALYYAKPGPPDAFTPHPRAPGRHGCVVPELTRSADNQVLLRGRTDNTG